MYRTMSRASGHNCFDKKDEEHDQRDEELERLRRLVRDLEFQAIGWHQRTDHGERRESSASVRDPQGARSHQSRSYRHRDCS